jgi:hypothetical protein
MINHRDFVLHFKLFLSSYLCVNHQSHDDDSDDIAKADGLSILLNNRSVGLNGQSHQACPEVYVTFLKTH